MNFDELVTYRKGIASFLGSDWRLIQDEYCDKITNNVVTLYIHYDPWKKKLDICGRPYAATPVEHQKYHRVLFEWVPPDFRQAWTLSIGCSLKGPEKIAHDIQRRLLPDVLKMIANVKERIAIDDERTDKLRTLVETFKQLTGNLPIREGRDQSSNYAWDGTLIREGYCYLAEIHIERESGLCNLKLNGITIEEAAMLVANRAKGEKVIP